MNSYTEEMEELFEDLRSGEEFQATLVYANGTTISSYVNSSGATYVSPDGDTYVARVNGTVIIGIKLPLGLGFQMQLSGYQRKADTSFDASRIEIQNAGLYLPVSSPNPVKVRPVVTVNDQPFMVLDCKDDNTSDPTVKLILSALQ